MRKNLPVTSAERTFPAEQRLISATDTQGVIQYCNDDFVAISGFQREEILGQPHNLVRHPDMPEQVFTLMWNYLKAGKCWMGIVKNRCKNGDYYWVNAYVTPILEHGKVVGYESVRIKPSYEQIQRAQQCYQRINEGKAAVHAQSVLQHWPLILGLSLVSGLSWLASAMAGSALVAVTACLGSGALYFLASQRQTNALQSLKSQLTEPFLCPISAQIYTGRADDWGQLQLAIVTETAHLRTVLTRLQDAALLASKESSQAHQLAKATLGSINAQQQETDQTATAMNEMTHTIAEVAQNVQLTSTEAANASELTLQGQAVAQQTKDAINTLAKQYRRFPLRCQNWRPKPPASAKLLK